MGEIIDMSKRRELDIIAKELAEKLNYNNVSIIANDEEFSVIIEGTDVKVSFWDDDIVSIEFNPDHAIVLPRDIFATLVSASSLIADIEYRWGWPEELELPLAEYKEDLE
mgnify:CR=1 FL=1